MNTTTRLAGFAGVLALAFGGAALAGGAVDPDRADDPTPHAGARKDHSDMKTKSHGGGHRAAAGNQPVRGLGVAEDGLRVVVDDPELRRGQTERLRFRIVDARGATVKDFSVEHEKRMHLIVTRRDLTGFQHLHPRQDRDGSWSTDVTIDEPGSYRLFADFARRGETTPLASDLRVDGPADLRPLPAPRPSARSDLGYDVALEREGDELRFTVSKDGETVHTEPYLGAGGHLVALREGDLAFLHVHPSEHGEQDGHDDSVAFETTFPTEGRYRLFLQVKHEGRVHTVAFTEVVR